MKTLAPLLLFLLTASLLSPLTAAEEKAQEKIVPAQKITLSFGDKESELGFIPFEKPQGEEENPGEGLVFEGPRAFHVDDAGQMYFLDEISVAIKCFDETGKYLKSFQLPVLDPSRETKYQDLQVSADGTLYILDNETGLIAVMDPKSASASLSNALVLPRKVGDSLLLVDGFSLQAGRVIFTDGQTGTVFELLKEKNAEGVNELKPLVKSPAFQSANLLDGKGNLIGFQSNQADPEIFEIHAQNSEETSSRILFALEKLQNAAGMEIIEVSPNRITLVLLTGGEEKTVLCALESYDHAGKKIFTRKLELEEIRWPIYHRYQVRGHVAYLLENPGAGNRLDIHKIKIEGGMK